MVEKKRKIIFDVDTGSDDALALMAGISLTLQGAGLHERRKDDFGQGAGLHEHRKDDFGQSAGLHEPRKDDFEQGAGLHEC